MKKYYYFIPLLLLISCMGHDDYITSSEDTTKSIMSKLNIKFESVACYEVYEIVRKFECVVNTETNSLIKIKCYPEINSVNCIIDL